MHHGPAPAGGQPPNPTHLDGRQAGGVAAPEGGLKVGQGVGLVVGVGCLRGTQMGLDGTAAGEGPAAGSEVEGTSGPTTTTPRSWHDVSRFPTTNIHRGWLDGNDRDAVATTQGNATPPFLNATPVPPTSGSC